MGDFNTSLSPIDRLSRQTNKEISKLNDTIDQMDLTNIYKIFHSAKAQYVSFSAALGNFSKIDHILGHKPTFNKYKETENPLHAV
jgi:ssDNA-specific exonuclease RecJ